MICLSKYMEKIESMLFILFFHQGDQDRAFQGKEEKGCCGCEGQDAGKGRHAIACGAPDKAEEHTDDNGNAANFCIKITVVFHKISS